jgi:hypothetical protein
MQMHSFVLWFVLGLPILLVVGWQGMREWAERDVAGAYSSGYRARIRELLEAPMRSSDDAAIREVMADYGTSRYYGNIRSNIPFLVCVNTSRFDGVLE